MNFDLSEQQALLKAMVERFARERGGQDVEQRRATRALPGGMDRAGWQGLAALGVLALPFAESAGGLGGGPVDLITAAEALGAGLATEPFTESLVMAGSLLEAAGDRQFLPGVIAGRLVPAAALLERAGRYNPFHVETRARTQGERWLLSGAKSAVWQGGAADLFLVSARVSGAARDRSGISLFAVPADRVERRTWRAADGSLAAELALRDVEAVPLDLDFPDACEVAIRRTWLAASAEMLGVASMLFGTTLSYVKTRVQFGRPIGQFQAIQHRLADAYVALEQARSLLYRAALAEDGGRTIAGAKAYVGEAATRLAHEAVQFHGGMGVTDELIVGHGLKRIQMLARLWGDGEVAIARFAEAA
ncbi:acyl-CoA dehydrogenase family protein [Thermaurantiacus sp.]